MKNKRQNPAAFRRLCVETTALVPVLNNQFPAAFRRLCVETKWKDIKRFNVAPAAFRRLCVETTVRGRDGRGAHTSRLQAAVC